MENGIGAMMALRVRLRHPKIAASYLKLAHRMKFYLKTEAAALPLKTVKYGF